ncbi:Gfo/Idh/MocA family protein [Chelatococcus asaccharovorans]|uniref:Putative dehydrogenase n=1 Tax=Chelatococcus asaccharovorans TaxID=28210 RepID=A0A2V3UDR1_9HYPH|nr:Gfo/Idh/MocA family oxidoreductase [Chelatococcus asaccharovorans]MBS7706970.1 Gfo/Idh/MocA family oxidoreductase [Chelatococcus asaccharovorans]PXW63150.1 putative dehydrogenase [Chelatococcus asaccharovorans]
MISVIELLGRRLRLGLIGGGGASLIGPVHRIAARLDDGFELVAGVLSSHPERALKEAEALGLSRGYSDVQTMLAAEAERPDGIDAVAIMTPNDSHQAYAEMALDAGLDVICDKPLTNDLASACALVAKARARGLVFCLTHNYSGYPMLREAKSAVAAGELGTLRLVQANYVQGSLGSHVEGNPEAITDRLRWRLDPTRGGLSHVLGDIGTHAHQMLTFVTGRRVEAVLADVGAVIPGRVAHDTASVILRLEGGARGVMFVTKAATGAENALTLEAYGEEGGLAWAQASANELRIMRNARPAELRTRGLPTLHPYSRQAARLPPGHPEAFFEAFANIYRDFASLVAARRAGREPEDYARMAPTAADGAEGLAFIEACLASTASGTWATVPRV